MLSGTGLQCSVPRAPVLHSTAARHCPSHASVCSTARPCAHAPRPGMDQPAGTSLPHRRCKYGCRRNSTPRRWPTHDEGGPAADAQAAVKLGEELASAKHSDSRASQGAKAPLEARRRRVPHARGLLIDCAAGGWAAAGVSGGRAAPAGCSLGSSHSLANSLLSTQTSQRAPKNRGCAPFSE